MNYKLLLQTMAMVLILSATAFAKMIKSNPAKISVTPQVTPSAGTGWGTW